jgi:hypothetical protein
VRITQAGHFPLKIGARSEKYLPNHQSQGELTDFAQRSDRWELVIIRAELKAMPRFVAANSEGDLPVHFALSSVARVKINKVMFHTCITGADGSRIDLCKTLDVRSGYRLVAGDAVRKLVGSNKGNGESNAYTVFVPRKIFAHRNLATTGHHRSSNISAWLSVQFSLWQGENEHVLTCTTNKAYPKGFLDNSIEVCHIGRPALLDATEGIHKETWRSGKYYTMRQTPKPHKWLRYKKGRYYYYNEPKENVEFKPGAFSENYRTRHAEWLPGDTNGGVKMDVAIVAASWGGAHIKDNEVWRDDIIGEEKGVIFVWLWGLKPITDLSGNKLAVLNLRQNEAISGNANLFPGASVRFRILNVDGNGKWTWEDTLSSGLGLASGIVAVVAPGPGWVVGAAYVTLVGTTAKTISEVMGAAEGFLGGDGATCRAFGGVTITKPSGQPYKGPWYGNPACGLSSPDHYRYTRSTEGWSSRRPGGVVFEQGVSAGETWKVYSSCSVSAWAEGGWLFPEDAGASLVYQFDKAKNGKKCIADSKAGALDDVSGQWVRGRK